MRACLRDVRFDDWASGSCSPASPGEARLSSIGSGLLPPGLRLEWGRCRFARTARSSSSMSSATTQASAQRRSRGWSGLARVPRSSKAMSSSRLRDLLDEFSTLDPRGSDAGEIECAGVGHNVALVSDPHHLLRASLIAKKLGLIPWPSPSPHTRYRSLKSKTPAVLREAYFLHHFTLFGE